jgi:hypothetical protein
LETTSHLCPVARLNLSYAEQIRKGADLFHGLAAHGAARVDLVAGISAMALIHVPADTHVR